MNLDIVAYSCMLLLGIWVVQKYNKTKTND